MHAMNYFVSLAIFVSGTQDAEVTKSLASCPINLPPNHCIKINVTYSKNELLKTVSVTVTVLFKFDHLCLLL